MKISEIIDKRSHPFFTFEIIPPLRGKSVSEVIDIVEKLVPFNPGWIDVTSHPAGVHYIENPDGTIQKRIFRKRPGTLGICGIIKNRFNLDTCAHILCNGFSKEETEDALIELNYLGIENVLALQGDGLNYNKKVSKERSANLYASDLIEQISKIKKGEFLDELKGSRPLDFCIGAAGYPEKHFMAPSIKQDMKYLKLKVDLGAEFIGTQMFFDNKKYFEFVKDCKESDINIPIIPGLKILSSVKQLQTIPKTFHIDFPDEFIQEVTENPDHVEELGINFAKKQVEELINAGVPNVHFYIMNKPESVIEVIKTFC